MLDVFCTWKIWKKTHPNLKSIKILQMDGFNHQLGCFTIFFFKSCVFPVNLSPDSKSRKKWCVRSKKPMCTNKKDK